MTPTPLPELTLQRPVTILGIGQMGLVAATMLDASEADSGGRSLTLWGHDDDSRDSLAQKRDSDRLPSYKLPATARVARNDAEAFQNERGEPCGLIVCAIPVQHIRETFTRLREFVPPGAGIVSCSKGIENGTLLRPTQIIADTLRDDPDGPPRPLGTLSGPTIASELARGLPATMVAASDFPGFSTAMQAAFATRWLRVYTHGDLLGVELAGALKNVIAIAAGIVDGLQAGMNAKSALLARGLAEITRLGTAMGASSETFFGVAGVGDLATTCFSPEGRNRSCGEALGKGAKLETYLEESKFVVEGVATTKSVVDLAHRYRVELPIVRAVHDILFEGLDPLEAIGMLMSRDLKDERIG